MAGAVVSSASSTRYLDLGHLENRAFPPELGIAARSVGLGEIQAQP